MGDRWMRRRSTRGTRARRSFFLRGSVDLDGRGLVFQLLEQGLSAGLRSIGDRLRLQLEVGRHEMRGVAARQTECHLAESLEADLRSAELQVVDLDREAVDP